jgi:outer membrane protein assembly factor BamB
VDIIIVFTFITVRSNQLALRFNSLMSMIQSAPFSRVLVILACALYGCETGQAKNWGHWRGDGGNGVSNDATPPTNWGPQQNIKWKTQIPGRGSSSPVVWDDRVFVTSAVPTSNSAFEFTVFCFDRNTGQQKWKKVATVGQPHEGTHSTNGFASASPCTDGEHVYAQFGSRGLYCYTSDGQLVWSRSDFPQMTMRGTFGEGSSPTIAGDLLIVPCDHEGQSALYALNKLTGKTVWETKRDEPSCWATPFVMESDGKTQIIMNGQTFARAYDAENGKELWRCGGQTQRPVACAVGAEGVVYVGSGFRGSFLGAFRTSERGDIESTDAVLWSVNRDTPDIASPLLSQGRLYYHKGKTGMLTCLDAETGTPHYTTTRVPGIKSTYASPVAAGGHVFVTGRSGTTVVLKDGNKFEVVANNTVGEPVDATPAIDGSELFIRGENHLFCISK